MLTVINTGAGNIQSVVNALTRIGATPLIASAKAGMLFPDTDQTRRFYFAHSFHFNCNRSTDVASKDIRSGEMSRDKAGEPVRHHDSIKLGDPKRCLGVPGSRMGQGQPLGLMRSCR
jgi:hypothetical protein